jgi:hypothetical protein
MLQENRIPLVATKHELAMSKNIFSILGIIFIMLIMSLTPSGIIKATDNNILVIENTCFCMDRGLMRGIVNFTYFNKSDTTISILSNEDINDRLSVNYPIVRLRLVDNNGQRWVNDELVTPLKKPNLIEIKPLESKKMSTHLISEPLNDQKNGFDRFVENGEMSIILSDAHLNFLSELNGLKVKIYRETNPECHKLSL